MKPSSSHINALLSLLLLLDMYYYIHIFGWIYLFVCVYKISRLILDKQKRYLSLGRTIFLLLPFLSCLYFPQSGALWDFFHPMLAYLLVVSNKLVISSCLGSHTVELQLWNHIIARDTVLQQIFLSSCSKF